MIFINGLMVRRIMIGGGNFDPSTYLSTSGFSLWKICLGVVAMIPWNEPTKFDCVAIRQKALATAPTELRNSPVVDADKHFSTQRFEKELGVLKT